MECQYKITENSTTVFEKVDTPKQIAFWVAIRCLQKDLIKIQISYVAVQREMRVKNQ